MTAADPGFSCFGIFLFPMHLQMVFIFPNWFDDKARNDRVSGLFLSKKIMFFINTEILNLQSSFLYESKTDACVSVTRHFFANS